MAELAEWAQLLPELAPVEAWFVMTWVSHALRCKDHSHRDRLPVACSTCAPHPQGSTVSAASASTTAALPASALTKSQYITSAVW